MSETRYLEVPAQGAIDPVTVFWQDFGPNKGQVTLTCWGSAWTAYFGGMGESSIEQFFAKASTSYLVDKLGYTQWLKQSKRHDKYLGDVIDAVKAHLKAQSTPAPSLVGAPQNALSTPSETAASLAESESSAHEDSNQSAWPSGLAQEGLPVGELPDRQE